MIFIVKPSRFFLSLKLLTLYLLVYNFNKFTVGSGAKIEYISRTKASSLISFFSLSFERDLLGLILGRKNTKSCF